MTLQSKIKEQQSLREIQISRNETVLLMKGRAYMGTYSEEINTKNTIRLRELLEKMPPFCRDYFRGIATSTSSSTRVGYCRNLYTFFQFMVNNNPIYKKQNINSLSIDILEHITPSDMDEYMEYLNYYAIDGIEYKNSTVTKARNLSAISNMYQFFNKRQLVKNNPTNAVERPKVHDKAIISLDQEQIFELLEVVKNPEKMSERQKKIHEHTVDRDVTIFMVFLGTGIRVSELVGLDVTDVDFNNQSLRVVRKGGDEEYVFFGDEVADALYYYLYSVPTEDGVIQKSSRDLLLQEGNPDEKALFISLKGQRMAVRSVQEMVKKYRGLMNINKKITPHKLRSTFGTTLYKETGDIYLVADVLGHKDVNTTKAHYAAQNDQNRKRAANVVRMKE